MIRTDSPPTHFKNRQFITILCTYAHSTYHGFALTFP